MHYLNNKEQKVIDFIRDFHLQNGHFPDIQNIMYELKFKSPHAVEIVLERLISNGFIEKSKSGNYRLLENNKVSVSEDHFNTVNVPFALIHGLPILAEESIEL